MNNQIKWNQIIFPLINPLNAWLMTFGLYSLSNQIKSKSFTFWKNNGMKIDNVRKIHSRMMSFSVPDHYRILTFGFFLFWIYKLA